MCPPLNKISILLTLPLPPVTVDRLVNPLAITIPTVRGPKVGKVTLVWDIKTEQPNCGLPEDRTARGTLF